MEKDDADSIIEKYQARLQHLKLTSSVKEVIDEEINKIRFIFSFFNGFEKKSLLAYRQTYT